MFGRRAVSVQLVKTPKPGKDGTTTETIEVDWEKIGKIAQETVESVGKAVAVAYVGKRVVDTVCQIAILTAKHKLK